ncbi:MAG: DUF2147 domain-containing protein [Nitrospiraceae bacterium]|nr:DUF2147 domain-containing protein [Nitrospiraceae bacterium]
MKKLFLPVVLATWLLRPSLAFSLQADDILGDWITNGGESCIEIFKKNGCYFGKIVFLKRPFYSAGEIKGMDGRPRMDLNNPKKSLRSHPLIGLEIMKGFRFDNGRWINGKIYDPENGESYNCQISLAKDGNLHVRGYIGVPLLGRTTIWRPAKVYFGKQMKSLDFGAYSFR